MPLLNTADKIYAGALEADRVYMGVNLVWPPAPSGAWGPDESLYDGAAPPGAPSDSNTFMVGNQIQILADGRITGVRYWAWSTSSTPRYAAIWSDAGALLADVTSTGETAGWNGFWLATPLLVSAGQIIRVAYANYGTGAFSIKLTDHVSASPNLLWLAGAYTTPAPSGAWDDFPNNVIQPNNYYGDVIYQEALESPGGVTAPDEWLITAYGAGSNRDDFTGEVGVRLNIVTAFEATWIGVRYAGGPTTGYKVNLYEWFADSLLRTVTIDLTGKAAGEFGWAAIEPITLLATGYYALMLETTASSGKLWANEGGVTMKPLIGNIYTTYRSPGGALTANTPGQSYVGLDLGWNVPSWTPADIAGLTVWLDASVLGGAVGSAVSPWADLSGNGNDGAVVGTPAPKISTSTLNGLKVVRFAMNEGRIRGNTGINLSGLPAPGYNFSIIYVTRLFGPNAGRVFAGAYPEYTNFLVGYHTSQMDCAYDGAFTGGTPWSVPPTPWRMFNYSASHDGTNYVSDFYIDGTRIGGLTGSGAGLHNRYHLSGYSQTGTEETCDGEVAELLIYHRKLTDPERTQVHDYLQAKWGL